MGREIDVGDDVLTIRYTGLNALAGLRREVRVPYARILDVSLGADDVPSVLAWRVGLAEPLSRRRLGRFWSRGRKWFLDLADPGRAVVLRLVPGSEFDAVAIEADLPEALLAALRERVSATRAGAPDAG